MTAGEFPTPRQPRPVHGTLIGIIVLDTGFERLPGDIAHAATWDFPVQFRVVHGVRPHDIIEGDPARALGAFYAAIDDLVATGARAIATSCGFLAAVHPELRAHSPVPFASSSLTQIPLVLSLLPQHQTVGVLVSDKAALTDRHFLNVGAPLGLPLGELPYDGPIRTGMRENRARVDAAAQERDALDTTARLIADHPEIGAIVSECANLPPYAAAIEREFDLPVYDVVTLVNWLHAGLAPPRFFIARPQSAGMSGHDLLVIGGGLIGSAIAWGAARSGADVALLDEGDIAFRAARGNFGLIWLQGKGVGTPPYMQWSLRAGRMWQAFTEQLQAETGIDIGWRPSGGLQFCFSDAEVQARRDMIARTQADGGEIDIEILDRAALADMLPGLGPDVLGASYSPLDSHVSPLYLLRALQAGLGKAGGTYQPGFRVDEIIPHGNGFTVLSAGRRLEGRQVVVAAGLGAAKLAPQVGLAMPVSPERGQIVVTERLEPFFPYAGNCLRQTAEGSVLLGSSHEQAGYNEGTDVASGAALCRQAVRIFPRLRDANVVRLWDRCG